MREWNAIAAGNTFRVIMGGRRQTVREYLEKLRIGRYWNFDSALVLEESERASVRMRIMERDGSESAMCGNGLRAVGRILDKLGIARRIEANGLVYTVDRAGDMYRAHFERISSRIMRGATHYGTLYHVEGEPHFVQMVHDVAVMRRWALAGASVNHTIVSHPEPFVIHARTFERGVDGETGSCGTGACAAVVHVQQLAERYGSYRVHMGDHRLMVHCDGEALVLEGGADAIRL